MTHGRSPLQRPSCSTTNHALTGSPTRAQHTPGDSTVASVTMPNYALQSTLWHGSDPAPTGPRLKLKAREPEGSRGYSLGPRCCVVARDRRSGSALRRTAGPGADRRHVVAIVS